MTAFFYWILIFQNDDLFQQQLHSYIFFAIIKTFIDYF